MWHPLFCDQRERPLLFSSSIMYWMQGVLMKGELDMPELTQKQLELCEDCTHQWECTYDVMNPETGECKDFQDISGL
jgi:hypothetical protein